MQPPILTFFLVSRIFLVHFAAAENPAFRKLTEAENLARQTSCGMSLGRPFQKTENNSRFMDNLVPLSTRHIVRSLEFGTFGFQFNKAKCKDNIQQFTIDSADPWNGTLGYYIGSCDKKVPYGIVIATLIMEDTSNFSSLCLPKSSLQDGSSVSIAESTSRNESLHTLNCKEIEVHPCNNAPDEMCTEQVVSSYGGPVLDGCNETATYVGHAFSYDNDSIHIMQIFPYLRQICEVSGICEKLAVTNYLSTISLPLKSENSFVNEAEEDNDEDNDDDSVTHYTFESVEPFTGDPVYTSWNTNLDSRITSSEVNGQKMDIEIEEVESSGASAEDSEELYSEKELGETSQLESGTSLNLETTTHGEKIQILFKSEEQKPESDYEPFVISAVPKQTFPQPVPKESTIVRAEPFSAVIIPLSSNDKATESIINSPEFSTPQELLIAFLIMLSLMFFTLMCIYGCVEYDGVSRYWQPDLGQLPV